MSRAILIVLAFGVGLLGGWWSGTPKQLVADPSRGNAEDRPQNDSASAARAKLNALGKAFQLAGKPEPQPAQPQPAPEKLDPELEAAIAARAKEPDRNRQLRHRELLKALSKFPEFGKEKVDMLVNVEDRAEDQRRQLANTFLSDKITEKAYIEAVKATFSNASLDTQSILTPEEYTKMTGLRPGADISDKNAHCTYGIDPGCPAPGSLPTPPPTPSTGAQPPGRRPR